MRKRDHNTTTDDLKKLNAAGFRVKCYSYIHWRVWKPGSTKAVDIWPTAGKYMALGESGASRYKDLVKDVAAKFAEPSLLTIGQDKIDAFAKFKQELNAKLATYGLSPPLKLT